MKGSYNDNGNQSKGLDEKPFKQKLRMLGVDTNDLA